MPITSKQLLIKISELAASTEPLPPIDFELPHAASEISKDANKQFVDIVEAWRNQIKQESTFAKNEKNVSRVEQIKILYRRETIFRQLSRLFYLVELNGDPGDHTKKLMHLFASATAAAKWLKYYADHTKSDQVFHDLCMFISDNFMPMPRLREFTENELQILFTNMSYLNLVTGNANLVTEELELLDRPNLESIVKKINEKVKQDEMRELGGTTLNESDLRNLEIIKSIHKKFHKPPLQDARHIIDVMKEAKNSDQYLPALVIKSEDIRLPAGYYMAKLPETDVRAALVGDLMGCCQHMSGQALSCVLHSITSEYGAVYAIFRGKVKNNTTLINIEKDTPMRMSWAWTAPDAGLICFDSIETDRSKQFTDPSEKLSDDDFVDVLYTEYAKAILNVDSMKHITTVSVGAGGATPNSVGRQEIYSEHILNPRINPQKSSTHVYYGYRSDSKFVQRVLATKKEQFSHIYNKHKLDSQGDVPFIPETRIPLTSFKYEYFKDITSHAASVFIIKSFLSLNKELRSSMLEEWMPFAKGILSYNVLNTLFLLKKEMRKSGYASGENAMNLIASFLDAFNISLKKIIFEIDPNDSFFHQSEQFEINNIFSDIILSNIFNQDELAKFINKFYWICFDYNECKGSCRQPVFSLIRKLMSFDERTDKSNEILKKTIISMSSNKENRTKFYELLSALFPKENTEMTINNNIAFLKECMPTVYNNFIKGLSSVPDLSDRTFGKDKLKYFMKFLTKKQFSEFCVIMGGNQFCNHIQNDPHFLKTQSKENRMVSYVWLLKYSPYDMIGGKSVLTLIREDLFTQTERPLYLSRSTWEDPSPSLRLQAQFPQNEDMIENVKIFFGQMTTSRRSVLKHFYAQDNLFAGEIAKKCNDLVDDATQTTLTRMLDLRLFLEEKHNAILAESPQSERALRLSFAIDQLNDSLIGEYTSLLKLK